jgi:hypothetical protein
MPVGSLAGRRWPITIWATLLSTVQRPIRLAPCVLAVVTVASSSVLVQQYTAA